MHVLFDFDGTLVNSFSCVYEKASQLAEEFSFRPIQEHEIEQLRDMSASEIMQFLQVPLYQVPFLISKMRKLLFHAMPTLMPVDGIPEVLEQLYKEQHHIGILTSNSVENVEAWLHSHNMRSFFSYIHSESHYLSKKRLIRKTISTYKIDRSQAIYIGDESRDIEAARKNNIQSLGVTWGYNSEKAILKCEPSFIAKTPEEILQCCRLFQQ